MKRSGQRRVTQEGAPSGPAPDKVGWVRKFCGRGLFREVWRNRYLVLRGERLCVCHREVRDDRGAQDVLDMSQYERCEELKKDKSRSKKSHSRFTLLRRPHAANTVHSLVFLALSPEEKESWIHALNAAIVRAKNRTRDQTLDQVAVAEDGALVHPTRDRARIPPGRRLPSRGHLLAVASSSHGSLTLDLVAEEDYGSRGSWERGVHMAGSGGVHVDCRVVGGRQRAGTDVSKLRPASREARVKTGSLPRASERNWGRGEASKALKNRTHIQIFKGQSRTPQPGKKLSSQGRNRCASMDEVLSSRPALIRSELRSVLKRCPTEEQPPVGQLQSLIAQRMQRAQELLEEMRLQELQKTKAQRERASHKDSPKTSQNQSKTSQNQSKTRSGGSGSPRVKAKDSPQTKTRKNKTKTSSDSPKLRDQTKTSQSPKLRDQTKTSQSAESPTLRSHTDSSPRPRTHSESQKTQTCSQSSPKTDQPTSSETGIKSPSRAGPEVDLVRSNSSDKNREEPTRDQDRGSEQSPSLEQDPCEEKREEEPDQDLEEVLEEDSEQDEDQDLDPDPEKQRVEAGRLLQEALCSWRQAQEVLQEVKELQSQTLRRQRRKTYQDLTKTAQTETRQTQTGSPAEPGGGAPEGAGPEESTPEGAESEESTPKGAESEEALPEQDTQS